MKKIFQVLSQHRCVAILALILIAFLIVPGWDSNQTKADISGYSQVTLLELSYSPGNYLISARVHLASGVALTHETQSEKESNALFEIAQIFSHSRARLFVDLEKDKIKSFQIAVP